MAGTYTQLYVQIVFAVQGRQNLISKENKEEINRYLSGIISGKGCKSIIVNGMADHIHAFVGLKPVLAISDLAREMKNNSSNFINENHMVNGKFNWQAGYGAFTYSRSQIENVYNYILNQEKHHKKKSFKEEYTDLLKKFEVEYDKKYLFEWYE